MVLALAGDSTTTSIEARLPLPLAGVDFLLAAAFLTAADFLLAVDFLLVVVFLPAADLVAVFLVVADLLAAGLALFWVALLAEVAVFFAGLAFFADALAGFLVAVVLSSSDGVVFRAALDVVEDLAWAMAFLAKRSMHDVPPTRQAGTAISELQINKYRRALGRRKAGTGTQFPYIGGGGGR